MTLTSLSVKGQVVIPKEFRDALGLQPGAKLFVTLEEDKIILKPVKRNVIAELYGKYKEVDLLADLQREHQREIRGELASK